MNSISNLKSSSGAGGLTPEEHEWLEAIYEGSEAAYKVYKVYEKTTTDSTGYQGTVNISTMWEDYTKLGKSNFLIVLNDESLNSSNQGLATESASQIRSSAYYTCDFDYENSTGVLTYSLRFYGNATSNHGGSNNSFIYPTFRILMIPDIAQIIDLTT